MFSSIATSPGPSRSDQLDDLGADDAGRELDRRADQLGQAVGARPQREAGLAVLRAAEVGDEDRSVRRLRRSSSIVGQGLADAGVVGDRPVLEGDVEVDANEDPLAVDVDIGERSHRSLWTTSTTRFE